MAPPPKLHTLLDILVKKIALAVVELSFLGPPADFRALLLTCTHIKEVIAVPSVFAEIFCMKFDTRISFHRHGMRCDDDDILTMELARRFECLRRLKDDTYTTPNDSESIRVDSWTAYLMLIENEGKNSRQLIEYAQVDKFAFNYVTLGGRLHEGAADNRGWPVDNEWNSVVIEIFQLTDEVRFPDETPMQRDNIIKALSPIYLGSFKYPSTFAPVSTFFIPPNERPREPHPLSLAGSPIWPPCIIPDYFGLEVILARPSMVTPAILSCIARFESINDAWNGPIMNNRLSQATSATASRSEHEDEYDTDNAVGGRHEHDWQRLRVCFDPWSKPAKRDHVFTPGMLHGNWIGRSFAIDPAVFAEMVRRERDGRPAPPPHIPMVFPEPIQFHIWEHHQRVAPDMAEFADSSGNDDEELGVRNAWFPNETTVIRVGKYLEIHDPGVAEISTYRTYEPNHAVFHETPSSFSGLYGDGVRDIILTAENTQTLGSSKGPETYCGRVRDWDGLVMLMRDSVDWQGRWIFYGYLHGDRNLVGRWRETEAPVEEPGWSGIWCMTKQLGGE